MSAEYLTVPEQAAQLTTVIMKARTDLAEVNRHLERLSQVKANTIAELNGALKALGYLVGGKDV